MYATHNLPTFTYAGAMVPIEPSSAAVKAVMLAGFIAVIILGVVAVAQL